MLVAVSIAVATITSGICYGPIDDIFNGVCDTTNCTVNSHNVCGLGNASADRTRDGGVFVLAVLLLITLVIRVIFSWLWRLLWK